MGVRARLLGHPGEQLQELRTFGHQPLDSPSLSSPLTASLCFCMTLPFDVTKLPKLLYLRRKMLPLSSSLSFSLSIYLLSLRLSHIYPFLSVAKREREKNTEGKISLIKMKTQTAEEERSTHGDTPNMWACASVNNMALMFRHNRKGVCMCVCVFLTQTHF